MTKPLPLLLLLPLLLSACVVRIPGFPHVELGETQTKELVAPLEGAQSAEVTLRFGAAQFELDTGAEELLEGKVEYNVDLLEPEVDYSREGTKAIVDVGPKEPIGISVPRGLTNDWDVKLTDQIPIALRVEAGAFRGTLDLSGLRLKDLQMRTGAAEMTVLFQEPNLQELDEIYIETGASKVEVQGLGDANFEKLTFNSGLGDYTLDFGGVLRRSGEVTIESGASTVTIVVPKDMGATVLVEGTLLDVDAHGFEQVSAGEYENQAFDGAEFALTIRVKIGLGSLRLRSE